MVNSESYLIDIITKRKEENESETFYISPNIPQKALMNAADKIAGGIDPTTILAIFDDSLFNNGKEGIVFTGTTIYLKQVFLNRIIIPLDNIISSEYVVETIKQDNGTEKEKKILTIKYSDESEEEITDADFTKLLDFLNEILNGFIENVDETKETIQFTNLEDLGDEAIETYISIVTTYLLTDDGKIDSKEYKELISLMAKIGIEKELAEKLREKRIGYNISVEESVIQLENYIHEYLEILSKKGIDSRSINQSLFFDLLLVKKENIDNWKDDKVLIKCQELLNITDEQIEFGIKKIKSDEKILGERLTDNQIKEMSNELLAIAGGAGVTLAALTITGGVSTGIGGGLLALGALSTGGLMLGLAAIGGASYGVYKGIKYFAGTSELEKSGIRISALQACIENNKKSVTYIIDDINWLTNKMSQITKQIMEENDIDNELNQLLSLSELGNNLTASAQFIDSENEKNDYEINLTRIPKKLPVAKIEELVKLNPNRVSINDFIYSLYEEREVTTDSGETKTEYVLPDEISYSQSRKLCNIFDSIGLYDTKSAAFAQGQAALKKGFGTLKNILGV